MFFINASHDIYGKDVGFSFDLNRRKTIPCLDFFIKSRALVAAYKQPLLICFLKWYILIHFWQIKIFVFLKYFVIVLSSKSLEANIYLCKFQMKLEQFFSIKFLFESEGNLYSWTRNKKVWVLVLNLRSVNYMAFNYTCYLTFAKMFLYLLYLSFHYKFLSSSKILSLYKHALYPWLCMST